MNRRLPDFIIGGAPRSGTQWLYSALDRHPDIEMAKPLVPEPKFFLRPDLYDLGLDHYSRTWFSAIDPEKKAGEKSTNYLESAEAAQRIARDLPHVRLIFALRNPIDRAFSNYLWSRQNGLETEDFETALALEAARERNLPEMLRYSRPHAFLSRGLYEQLLRPYFDRFARERILVVRYEDMVSSPDPIMERLHRFLGVEPRPQDAQGLQRMNAVRNLDRIQMKRETRARLAVAYAEANARLCELLGPEFQGWKEA